MGLHGLRILYVVFSQPGVESTDNQKGKDIGIFQGLYIEFLVEAGKSSVRNGEAGSPAPL